VAAIEGFLLSGRAADLILLVLLLEAGFLTRRAYSGTGAPVRRWLSQLVAGAALVIALRIALTGGAAGPLGLALGVAGLAHAAGYRQRWER
jgi:hypothetical protein